MKFIDRDRLVSWVVILLLVISVALVVHTHLNTSQPIELEQSTIQKRYVRHSHLPLELSETKDSVGLAPSSSVAQQDPMAVVEQFAPHAPDESGAESNQHSTGHGEEALAKLRPNSEPDPQKPFPPSHNSSTDVAHSRNLSGESSMISFLDRTTIKAQHVASAILDQTLQFLDPVVHGHQHAVHKTPSPVAPGLHDPQPATTPHHAPKKEKDDGRLTFLHSDSETVKAHRTPMKRSDRQQQRQDADLAQLQTENYHPRHSPRKATDISPANHLSLLLCPNQSKCIVPELQLEKKLKVYFCKHPTRHGVRFYFLAREGLLLHPGVELVSEEQMNTADFIVYLPGSAPWHLTECRNESLASRLIVLDEFDGHTLFSPGYPTAEHARLYGGPSALWYFMYFKRSFVRRHDGLFTGYPHLLQRDVFPLTYSLAEAYIPHHFNTKREIEILCTLRGSKAMSTRLRVQTWVGEYAKERHLTNVISSQVNTASRTTVSKQYFEQMYNAQIIVTVNPANWEGDFRLWEALSTGALIFVDPVFVPHPFPLLDREHVVYFSNRDRDDLFQKLDYYRSHPEEARRIAVQGYLHAMTQHRTVNMIDYILRTAHVKQLLGSNTPLHHIPPYRYTGQYLNHEARVQEPMIKKCHTPGLYAPLNLTSPRSDVVHLTSCPEPAKLIAAHSPASGSSKMSTADSGRLHLQ